MNERRPVGIVIYALTGIFLGGCSLAISVFYVVFKSCFVVLLEARAFSIYVTFLIYLVLGSCFLISSLALLRKKP